MRDNFDLLREKTWTFLNGYRILVAGGRLSWQRHSIQYGTVYIYTYIYIYIAVTSNNI